MLVGTLHTIMCVSAHTAHNSVLVRTLHTIACIKLNAIKELGKTSPKFGAIIPHNNKINYVFLTATHEIKQLFSFQHEYPLLQYRGTLARAGVLKWSYTA